MNIICLYAYKSMDLFKIDNTTVVFNINYEYKLYTFQILNRALVLE
jgi:hypothetical protein